jgi:hypothetical protein
MAERDHGGHCDGIAAAGHASAVVPSKGQPVAAHSARQHPSRVHDGCHRQAAPRVVRANMVDWVRQCLYPLEQVELQLRLSRQVHAAPCQASTARQNTAGDISAKSGGSSGSPRLAAFTRLCGRCSRGRF